MLARVQPVGSVVQRPAATQPTWLRWAFVAMSVLMTIVVAASIASSFFGARELADTIARGQAALLEHSATQALRHGPPPPSDADLEALVEVEAGLGLRYVAVVGARGVLLASGGDPFPEFDDDPIPLEPVVEIRGAVARSMAVLGGVGGPGGPPPPRGPGGPWDPFAAGPPEGRGPPLRIVLEFEPTMVTAVNQRARRDLAIGLLACAVFWGAAVLFWRLATRAAQAEAILVSQRQLTALGEMSAVVAHELRNPLASLKGHAQLLCDQVTEPRALKKARRVLDEAVRLQELSTGLLEFVRSGRVDLVAVDVSALARQAADASGVQVDLDVDDAPGVWTLDRARIRQVVINLLENARDAAPGEPVRMRVAEHGGALLITVQDRGPGIPADQRERVFAPFATTKTKGTGLGLAVARRIIELHGGTIACEDHPKGGAVFRAVVPRPSVPATSASVDLQAPETKKAD